MTQYTPEQARHIAGCMERGAEMRNMGAPALRSLADQVEALTAERDAPELVAGAHPAKGTSALSEVDRVPLAWQITYASADVTTRTVVHGHNAIGDYRQIDPAATSVPLYAAPVVPVPVALDSLWHLKLMMEYSAFGGVLQLEDALANIDDFAATATPPQALPVAQLSESVTDEQMDSIYRDVWTTVPHAKRLFEFGRRVIALAAAPTTPKE